MERLTECDYLDGIKVGNLKVGVDTRDAIDHLSAYEDTGLEPEEVAELAQAKADGRLVVLDKMEGKYNRQKN